MRTVLLLIISLTANAAGENYSQQRVDAGVEALDNTLDEESGYTFGQLRRCEVIVESNQSDCDDGTDTAVAAGQARTAIECITEDAPKASDGRHAEARYIARVQSCLNESSKF